MSRLRAFQLAFGRRIRAGARAPLPAGVPRQRMAVYEELLFNNLRSFLDRCFPVGRACLGELRWTRLCRAFYRDWPCATAWFREIPREFVDYLEAGSGQRLPRWFAELARYEWAELAVDVMDVVPPAGLSDGDLVEGCPVVNPALLSLAFQWPVHRIGPDARPRRPAPVQLLVYRDAADEVCFVETNPATARLLSLLQGGSVSGREALVQLAAELGRAPDAAFMDFGRHSLADLRRLGVLLGTAA
ncbi:MAG: putative DNA-binding domain-containing protein [Zoogloea sp.]|nr:putative DNA-binding domain-containing protein [Zoogloea sp.]